MEVVDWLEKGWGSLYSATEGRGSLYWADDCTPGWFVLSNQSISLQATQDQGLFGQFSIADVGFSVEINTSISPIYLLSWDEQ